MDTATVDRLGTRLRNLVDRLDGDVQLSYASAGLPFRPRYTPIVRALAALGSACLKSIAEHSGLTHSAVSQTVALMRRDGLVEIVHGQDARQRRLAPTAKLNALLPRLEVHWAATNAAARVLDAELSGTLTRAVDAALAALDKQSFAGRIAQQRPDSREA